MISKYGTKQIKLNKPLGRYPAGSIIPIKVDKKGTPIDRYWRDRKKDSKIDNCIELVEPVKSKKKGE